MANKPVMVEQMWRS